MKKILLLPLLLFLSQPLFATPQMSDILIHKGDTLPLYGEPLSDYFIKNPAKRPQSGIESSDLWRGYVATFEIVDNQLWVRDVEIMVWDSFDAEGDMEIKWISVMDDVFPNESDKNAKWFSRSLVTLAEKPFKLPVGLFGPDENKYIVMDFVEGILKNEREYEPVGDYKSADEELEKIDNLYNSRKKTLSQIRSEKD